MQLKSEHEQLANRLKVLADRYRIMGMSARDAAQMQLQVARLVNQGKTNLALEVIKEQEAHVQNGIAMEREAKALAKLQSKMLNFGGTVSGVSLAMSTLSTDTDSFIAELGDAGLAIGTGITALGLLIEQVDKLKKAYDAATASGIAAGLLKAGTVAGATVGAIGGLGIGAGVFIGGIIADYSNYATVFFAASIAVLLGFLLFLFVGDSHYKKNKLEGSN